MSLNIIVRQFFNETILSVFQPLKQILLWYWWEYLIIFFIFSTVEVFGMYVNTAGNSGKQGRLPVSHRRVSGWALVNVKSHIRRHSTQNKGALNQPNGVWTMSDRNFQQFLRPGEGMSREDIEITWKCDSYKFGHCFVGKRRPGNDGVRVIERSVRI